MAKFNKVLKVLLIIVPGTFSKNICHIHRTDLSAGGREERKEGRFKVRCSYFLRICNILSRRGSFDEKLKERIE